MFPFFLKIVRDFFMEFSGFVGVGAAHTEFYVNWGWPQNLGVAEGKFWNFLDMLTGCAPKRQSCNADQ